MDLNLKKCKISSALSVIEKLITQLHMQIILLSVKEHICRAAFKILSEES